MFRVYNYGLTGVQRGEIAWVLFVDKNGVSSYLIHPSLQNIRTAIFNFGLGSFEDDLMYDIEHRNWEIYGFVFEVEKIKRESFSVCRYCDKPIILTTEGGRHKREWLHFDSASGEIGLKECSAPRVATPID